MKWVKDDTTTNLPIKSWCRHVEDGALEQAINLSNHPVVIDSVALMPDCHVGYGMPIGGVIACDEAVIPNAVGVDIGCGMAAVKTNLQADVFNSKKEIRDVLEFIKDRVPVGEGHSHRRHQEWEGFSDYLSGIEVNEENLFSGSKKLPEWLDKKAWELAHKNLGTLGGGNHFIELQKDTENVVWLMLHSGSRNLGHRIASFYHKLAMKKNKVEGIKLPDNNLAFLNTDEAEGKDYIRDMNFALKYALENRQRMLNVFKNSIEHFFPSTEFVQEINIHHNYAAYELHDDKKYWIHRKGATSAKQRELGIIPGSMGTSSYIVEGLGNKESFNSCSHGAGRKMGRMEACRNLTIEECDEAMEDVVFDRWKKLNKWGRKNRRENLMDLGEAPLAYKNIDEVIQAQLDLINPLVKLKPLGVVKG